MGDYADDIIEGVVCESCGGYVNDNVDRFAEAVPGFSVQCRECRRRDPSQLERDLREARPARGDARVNALAVACQECGAGIGKRCRTPNGKARKRGPHAVRLDQ